MGSSPVSTSKSVGRLLRGRREALGFSLREVSRHAASRGEAIPASTLARIEQGRLDPGVRRLTALVRLYDLDPEHVSDLVELESLAVETPSGDLETLIRAGVAHSHAGNLPQALAHVFAVRAHAANDPVSRLMRQKATLHFAVLARNLGKERLARKLVDDLLCEPPDAEIIADVLLLAASLWNKAGSTEMALALVARAAVHHDPADVLRRAQRRHQEAKILLAAGRADDAGRILDQALEDYRAARLTHDEMSARILRVAVLEALGRRDEAIAWARETIAASDANGHPRVAAHARLELGRALHAAGRHQEALDELRRALASAQQLGDPYTRDEALRRIEAVTGRRSHVS